MGIKSLDSNRRLVDVMSGGPANALGLGDVNDAHTYPDPTDIPVTPHRYGMIGEYSNAASFVPGHEWQPGRCSSIKKQNTSDEMEGYFIKTARELEAHVGHISASVYTQTTDIEDECDGWMTFDRLPKFDANQTARARAALQALIDAAKGPDYVFV